MCHVYSVNPIYLSYNMFFVVFFFENILLCTHNNEAQLEHTYKYEVVRAGRSKGATQAVSKGYVSYHKY